MIHTNALFAEQANVIAYAPLDMAGTPGIQTPYISLKNYARATVLLVCAAGGAETATMTFQQATAIAGTGVKNLAVVTRIDKKEHATALEGIGTWTTVAQAAGNTFALTQAVQSMVAIDIKAEDLDADNGFDVFRCTVADVGATAKLGAIIVILWGSRYEPPLSPLVN